METFLLAFALMLLVMLGMALGVIFMNKRIKGSCGGLNAISDADQCLVCKKEVDPNSPLKERLQGCPKAKKILAQMEAEGA
ncbi:MAG: (Na+)-NQR maturation NqrM [Pseudomonadota bacterium]